MTSVRTWPLRTMFWVGLTLFGMGMAALTAFTLVRLRNDAVVSGLDIAAMHARGIEDYLTQSLHVAELVASNAVTQALRTPQKHAIEASFVAILKQVPFLRSMSLLDGEGRIVASSNPLNVGVNVETDGYLPSSQDKRTILRIGPAWAGRDFAVGRPADERTPVDADERSFVAIARTTRVGEHPLTLIFALNPDYFLNHFSQRLSADEGSVEILRYDGMLLMDTGLSGQPGAKRDHILRDWPLADVEFGQFEQTFGKNKQVLTAFRASRLYPFIVVTHLDRSYALRYWQTEAETLLSVVLPALLLITVLALGYYRRQVQFAEQRDRAERLQRVNAASVFTNAREGIMITDPDGTIIDVNDAFSRITGFSREEALGRPPGLLRSDRHGREFYEAMWRDLLDVGYWCGEIWNQKKDGRSFAGMLTISAVRDEQGNTQQYVALFSDITVLKEHESQLEQGAHYDALTALPNRALLADRLQQGIRQTQRRGQRLTVVFLDLDGFKAINDHYGHEAGDSLLIAIAGRMKSVLRDGDTLARLGGDEFVAVLPDLADVACSAPILNRLIAAAAEPVHVGDQVLQVSASLGVTFYPQTEEVDADQLLRQADQAMYQAKLAGKNCYSVFDADQDRNVRGRHESVEEIRRALAANEFVLHYQPRVNMRSGLVMGAEALIRWQHPERGLLLPAAFLPLIENHSLAVEVGEWVIGSVMQQMARWQDQGLEWTVSVNLGARQLLRADFVEFLRRTLAAFPQLVPGKLELEVLETSALEDLPRVSAIMKSCLAMGVSFALDDFGTGYSSLTYLKNLPVSQIKIDRSFVADMLEGGDNLAILEGIIGLSTAFHHSVTAEGVETVQQGEILLQLGCEHAQGFGIARPMPAEEVSAWSAKWRPSPEWTDRRVVVRHDWPIVFACVEHRAWMVALEAFLNGQHNEIPELDPQRCRFGRWLNSEMATAHRAQSSLSPIDGLHRQVHAFAAELVRLNKGRQHEAMLEQVGDLYALSNRLVEQLQAVLATARPG